VESTSTSIPGSGGGTSSGGGFFVSSPQTGNGQVTITPTTSVSSPITVTLLPQSQVGQVLGVTAVNFGRNLKLGMTGDDILALQTLLKTGGYLVINVPTNYFGAKTFAALKKWQKAYGLPATGFFGPMSRGLLNK
jgi:peptidoglycan hydrolase-like protein with peptidoglycan-binding domain